MSDADGLRRYYAERAREYERIYHIPERQGDIAQLKTILQNSFVGEDVLEIACGTGYWTQPISLTARSILATDVNPEVIKIALKKDYPLGNVSFQLADAFTLEGVEGKFTAAFAGFWWSHIQLSKLDAFIHNLHRKISAGSLVVFIDNANRGSLHPITSQDSEGNTYQRRKLDNGNEYDVLKNFPTEAELRERLVGVGENIRYITLPHYWCLSYTVSRKDD